MLIISLSCIFVPREFSFQWIWFCTVKFLNTGTWPFTFIAGFQRLLDVHGIKMLGDLITRVLVYVAVAPIYILIDVHLRSWNSFFVVASLLRLIIQLVSGIIAEFWILFFVCLISGWQADSWLCISCIWVLQNSGEKQGRHRRTSVLVSILVTIIFLFT